MIVIKKQFHTEYMMSIIIVIMSIYSYIVQFKLCFSKCHLAFAHLSFTASIKTVLATVYLD